MTSLQEMHGPNWEAVHDLVCKATVLTSDEIERLGGASVAAQIVFKDGADNGVLTAASDAQQAANHASLVGAAALATQAAVTAVTQAAAADVDHDAADLAIASSSPLTRAAAFAAGAAALALVARDHIPPDTYATLTLTWATVIGPVHPDDPDLDSEDKP